ncbi:MAG: glycoside hydrolase family 13 protein [Lachnospiraceae bacterium]|nr:glycoside hydrolase family 13 protein [Lachnospiraceae bacterium]
MNPRKIDREALFADETVQYRTPAVIMPGDDVKFYFRTKKDDAASVMLLGREIMQCMEKTRSDGLFDYYETTMKMTGDRFHYWFLVERGRERLFYNRLGVVEPPYIRTDTAFEVLPGFSVPDWAKGAVMYQIFIDRFRNGDPGNDVLTDEYSYLLEHHSEHASWDSGIETLDVHRFYGGDLQGVEEKLPYLKRLGIEAIYFTPIFVSPSNHGYDTQDYEYIDPHLTGFVHDEGELLKPGDTDNTHATRYIDRVTNFKNLEKANEVFASFVKKAHEAGIRVILDGVFNHCGSFNKWMDREHIYKGHEGYEPGAFVSKDSPYHDYFYFSRDEWPDNESYIGWWDNTTLPKLNYEGNSKLKDYICNIGKKWVRPPYSIDGWRLDVASDLGLTASGNHTFWRAFRRAVKSENPDTLIVAEHYGNPEHWLRGNEWDTVMNYDAFMEPVSFFLTGMEKHSREYSPELHGSGKLFFENLMLNLAHLPIESRLSAMNQLSNHDHSRFLTRTNRRTGSLYESGAPAASEGLSYATFREGVVMQFTLPGAPTLYYGDEAGLTGWTDPDNRRPYPWGHENWDLVMLHKDLIRIHKTYSCLRTGSFKPLASDYGYVSYARFDEESSVVTLINHSDHERMVSLPVWTAGMPYECTIRRIMQTDDANYNAGELKTEVRDGLLQAVVPAWSATVYAYRKKKEKA